jgi:hypothetical protein
MTDELKSLDLEALHAHTRLVRRHILKLTQQHSISLDDIAWINRHLNRLRLLYQDVKADMKETGEIDREDLSNVKHLINQAHTAAGVLIEKEADKEVPSEDTKEIDVDLFPEGLDKKLYSAYHRLKDIIHAFHELKMRPMITHKELGHLQSRLEDAENHFKKIKFDEEGEIPEGQAALSEMFEELYEEIYSLVVLLPDELEEEPKVDELLVPLENKLKHIIENLETLKAKPKEWLRTEDVGRIQNRLSDIDKQYSDERICRKGKIPAGQAIISELLEKAHELAHEVNVIVPMTPDAEKIQDKYLRNLHKKLRRILHHLYEIEKKPEDQLSLYEIGHLQNQLSRIDNYYEEGKFTLHGEVPKGQAYLAEELDKAHQVVERIMERL